MERRQTVVETELKLCKCIHQHTTAVTVTKLWLSLQQNTRSSLLFFLQGILTTTRTHKGTLSRPYSWLGLWVPCFCIRLKYLTCVYVPLLFIHTVVFAQNYDTTESKLRREFEVYGPIKRVSGLNLSPRVRTACLITFCYLMGMGVIINLLASSHQQVKAPVCCSVPCFCCVTSRRLLQTEANIKVYELPERLWTDIVVHLKQRFLTFCN